MSRILLVDDDSGSALILRSRLSAREHEVTLAESGARSLALAREQRFEAVLVSAHLKRGIDAVETCKRMRAIPEQLGAALLMYSQESERPEHPERAFEAGSIGRAHV